MRRESHLKIKRFFFPSSQARFAAMLGLFLEPLLFMNWEESEGSLGQREARFVSEVWRRKEEPDDVPPGNPTLI